MTLIGKIFEKLMALAGALILSQAPVFMLAYTQVLSGHVSELKWQMDAMQKVAGQSGKTLEQFVQKFLASQDTDFKLQGQLMQGIMERWNNYSDGLFAMQHATVWARPFEFIRHFDWSLAQSTYGTFQIGLTLNLEGIIYALIGLLIGYCLAILIRHFLSLIFIRPKKQSQEEVKQ